MGNKNLGTFILIATIVAQAIWVCAADDKAPLKAAPGEKFHFVGDDKGWTVGVDYQAWADANPIREGEKLQFNYDTSKHNVVQIGSQEYDSCEFDQAKKDMRGCGFTYCTMPGPPGSEFIFASAMGNDCKEGMKIKIVVQP